MTVARVDLLHGERTVARVDAEVTLDAWYEWASSLPAPRRRRTLPSEGNLRAQAQQDVDQNGVVGLIYEVFGDAGASAARVAWCESKYDETAFNGVHVGIFQLSGRYHRARAERLGFTWEQVSTEAYANIVVAHDLYLEQGWGPWSCRWAA